MRKEVITYTDYNGEQRTEEFWFNLSKAEVLEMEMTWDGGLKNFLERIIAEQDQKRIIEMFKMLVLKAYGERSLDGKKFLKQDADGRSLAQQNFVPTEAYSELFMKLATDEQAASDFVNGIVPKNLEDKSADKKVEDKSGPAQVLPGPGSENK